MWNFFITEFLKGRLQLISSRSLCMIRQITYSFSKNCYNMIFFYVVMMNLIPMIDHNSSKHVICWIMHLIDICECNLIYMKAILSFISSKTLLLCLPRNIGFVTPKWFLVRWEWSVNVTLIGSFGSLLLLLLLILLSS